jgi:hypothetical protein
VFVDMVSDSTLQLTLKKATLAECLPSRCRSWLHPSYHEEREGEREREYTSRVLV